MRLPVGCSEAAKICGFMESLVIVPRIANNGSLTRRRMDTALCLPSNVILRLDLA